MKHDIQLTTDIQKLVDTFYQQAIHDDVIGHFFTEVIPLNFDEHLPTMYQFWETVLLGKATYKGNPMVKHIQLNRLSQLEEKHFNRWVELWEQTVNQLFTGETAEMAIQRAKNIANLMQYKIQQSAN